MAVSDNRVDAYARAILDIAAVEGYSSETEDQLFRFARTLEANDNLRSALSDRTLPVDRRLAVVEELLAGKALPVTVAMVSMIVAVGRGNDLPAIVDRFVELSADERRHEVAEVRSAVALTDTQVQQLAAALSRATGKHVEVKTVVDPSVLGGVVARIGDTVIDGSVRRRLNQLEETI
jgi:F-type H+-transporting ATPase subunit delta